MTAQENKCRNAHPAGKGHFRGRIGNQRHRLILLSPSYCSATAPLEMPMPSALHELQCPVGDKPRLTIATDTSLMMQEDSFSPVSPKRAQPCWLVRSSQVAQVPEPISSASPMAALRTASGLHRYTWILHSPRGPLAGTSPFQHHFIKRKAESGL